MKIRNIAYAAFFDGQIEYGTIHPDRHICAQAAIVIAAARAGDRRMALLAASSSCDDPKCRCFEKTIDDANRRKRDDPASTMPMIEIVTVEVSAVSDTDPLAPKTP